MYQKHCQPHRQQIVDLCPSHLCIVVAPLPMASAPQMAHHILSQNQSDIMCHAEPLMTEDSKPASAS